MELLVLDSNTRNYLTVCKQMSSGSFKTLTNTFYSQMVYIYMYKQDLALNNLQWLI